MCLIKTMSMGVGSARSSVNVIEALERAMRRLEAWLETQAQNTEVVDSGYERFKNWEMLWKTGPATPVPAGPTTTTTTTLPSPKNPGPTPCAPVGGAAAPPGTSHGTIRPRDAHNTTTSPHIPHFGLEGFVSNFPQELGEFHAIPCFEGDGGGGAVGDRWSEFVMDDG
ncbi:hypothetical protein VTN02DRAFT_3448 [Thermoascus thermophilus]